MPHRHFTLLEILVAMSILVVLGTSLLVILRGGLQTWRRSEARRESFDHAQAVLLQLRDDLNNALAPPESPLKGLGEVEARLMCMPGAGGRTQLFLVRSLKAENEHPITGHAGSQIGADAVIDQRDDLAEARAARLRATGGEAEVAWVHGPGGVLYRGIRTPIGPPGSLFEPDSFELAPPPGAAPAAPAASQAGPQPALLRPFALEVIHFECLFWSQYTTTWSTQHPPVRNPRPNERPGPLDYWDSTRALLRFPDADPDVFHTFKAADSLTDPRDDIFPANVQVTLAFREPSPAGSSTFLAAPVAPGDEEIVVEDPSRLPEKGFVYVNDEWIAYDAIEGRRLQVSQRGARNTQAQQHEGSEEVYAGHTFSAVLEVPAWREDPSDGAGRRP